MEEKDWWAEFDATYDFGGENAQTYDGICPGCERVYQVSSQKDRNPEYYTEFFLRCHFCGASIKFILPVN